MGAFNFIFPREGGNIKQPGVGGEVPDNLLLQYCFFCKKLEALDQDQHSSMFLSPENIEAVTYIPH